MMCRNSLDHDGCGVGAQHRVVSCGALLGVECSKQATFAGNAMPYHNYMADMAGGLSTSGIR